MMAGRFVINSPAHLMADSRIISPAPQQFPEIRSCTILKTWFEISLRCQSHPVSGITELMRDSIDKSDLPFKSRKMYIDCRTVSESAGTLCRLTEFIF